MVSVVLAVVLPAGARSADPGAETLASRMQALVSRPRFARALWGVQVIEATSGRVVYSTNADKLFIPASNTKLFTAALALDRLGPDFRMRTSLLASRGPDCRGRLRGDLVVYGRGDPGFQVAAAGGDWDRALGPLVEVLRRAGVRRVDGDLVADESCFRGPAVGSGWEYDDLGYYYGAGVSALSLNDNAVDVVVRPGAAAGRPAVAFLFPSTRHLEVVNRAVTGARDASRRIDVVRVPESDRVMISGVVPLGSGPVTESVSVPRSAEWFGEEFRGALARAGIAVRGQVRVKTAADGADAAVPGDPLVELGGSDSAPLRELLPRMLKPSQNLHAQLLFWQAGRADAPPAGITSEAAGVRALRAFLDRAGIEPDEARFEEGSGLSRHNVVTPRAIVKLLGYMARHPHAAVFRDALPVAGVDGSLRNRMRGTAAEGNLRAKTGTLDMVYTLSGYVTPAGGEPLVFALMLNQYTGATTERPGRVELDELAVLLAGAAATP